MVELVHRELTGRIINAAIEVHRELGPGLLESAYETCLAYLMTERGLRVERQVPIPVCFRGVELSCGYRADLVVEDAVLIEFKCVESVLPIHEAQLLTYLKLASKRVGLLLNFNCPTLRQGLKRIIL